MRKYQSFIWIIAFFVLSSDSCVSCSGQEEPNLTTDFRKNGNAINSQITNVSFINSTKIVVKNEQGQFILPLDMRNDKTTFNILHNSGVTYQLTLSYQRKTKYQGKDCGFVIEFENIEILKNETSENLNANIPSSLRTSKSSMQISLP